MACAISETKGILIDGSNKAFGYVTQSANFNFSFGDSPSTADITLIKDPEDLSEDTVSLFQKYALSLGGIKLNMKAISVAHNRSATGATTQTINFVDTSIDYLDKYFIALNREHLQTPSPSNNVIGLGDKYALKHDIDGHGNVSRAPSRAYVNIAAHVAARNAAYRSVEGKSGSEAVAQMIIPSDKFQEYIDSAEGTSLYMADDFFNTMMDTFPGKFTERIADMGGGVKKRTIQPQEIPFGYRQTGTETIAVQIDPVGAKEVCPDFADEFVKQFETEEEEIVYATMNVLEERGEFVNYTGSIRSVLSAFAKDYALMFFWDPFEEKVVFLDAMEGVSAQMAAAKSEILGSGCDVVSVSDKIDASNTFVRGAMGQFSADEGSNDNKRVGTDAAELVTFNNFVYMNCQGEQKTFKLSLDPKQAKNQARRMNDDFLTALKAAAIGSKFYGMYVLYQMMTQGEGEGNLYDDDVPPMNAGGEAVENLANGMGAKNAAPGKFKLNPVPVGGRANSFIKSVYKAKNCPNTVAGEDGCLGRLRKFDDANLNKLEEAVKAQREGKAGIFTVMKGQGNQERPDPDNKNPIGGEIDLGAKGIFMGNGPAPKMTFKQVIDLLNERNPAIACVCISSVNKEGSTILEVIVKAADNDGAFQNAMAVNGNADDWIFGLIERNSAQTIFSKTVDAKEDQMYQLLNTFAQIGNRYYVLKAGGGDKLPSKEIKIKGKKVKREYDFMIVRQSSASDRKYAIPSGASVKGINPYIRADQDNPFKDLFKALLKMTYGADPSVGTNAAGSIEPEEYPCVMDFVAGLLNMSKAKKATDIGELKDMFQKFSPAYTSQELEEKRKLAQKNCQQVEDDVVMLMYDTGGESSMKFPDAVGEEIKKAEDGQYNLTNSRTKNIATNYQALIDSDCGYSPVGIRGKNPGDAIPANMDLPIFDGDKPDVVNLVYAYDHKAKWHENDGYFKTSAVHVPDVPENVVKLEMDLGVSINAPSLGYADSSFSQITDDELLGNGYSSYFQGVIANRLQQEVAKKVQSESEPSVSTTFNFVATDSFPSLPSPTEGLESLSLSVGETVSVTVTVGNRVKAESAARMRNSPITLIGGNSSVQTIAQNPQQGVLPGRVRSMLNYG